MCMNAAEWDDIPSHPSHFAARKPQPRRRKDRGFTRKRSIEDKGEKDIELKNLKLYLENRTIIEENEKLRRKASLLHQENLALMSELQKKKLHFISSHPASSVTPSS
ncbi:protein LITTLE ZIPPER 1-like [Malania oleifera]|uniref:protein LITTLE ZIPPER 1-like n=1 Tax=Malania oleifera TaxID=397392 RepID=UPI0025AE8551|nr:protein LITTLE ZIPPER 1-like [Malania oleifera]